ncbi:MAG: PEP-CTERM sorting domain-containing protein [Lentisphaeria bacterium]
MNLSLSPRQKSLLMLMPFACLPAAQAAIQPNQDNVYGNSINLGTGTQTIWNSDTTETAFKNLAYAVDGQVANYVTWTPGSETALQLASTASWADGSVTWKFVAPTGYGFAGGTISIQAEGIWGACTVDLKAYSQYVNNGYGIGGYQAGTGVLYDSDTHSMGEWDWDNWTVDVPAGISEFYVTAASNADYRSVWANSLTAQNITIPEPAALSLLALGGLLLFRRRRE